MLGRRLGRNDASTARQAQQWTAQGHAGRGIANHLGKRSGKDTWKAGLK